MGRKTYERTGEKPTHSTAGGKDKVLQGLSLLCAPEGCGRALFLLLLLLLLPGVERKERRLWGRIQNFSTSACLRTLHVAGLGRRRG